ncbi:MAG: GAF domain-containing protein [Anaerolineales bacterium]|nr:GAF domain-containing protein [Anaerolineales bacterium]
MKKNLRVLLIEDTEADELLLLREMNKYGYQVDYQRIETAAEMQAALDNHEWDLILCDYSLPQFHAMQALKILKDSGRDLPFIIVSGTIGEETAVEALKAGAHDFIVKGNYARLNPAIEREMRDAEFRRERRAAIEALQRSEEHYRMLFKANPHPMWVYDAESLQFLAVNEAAISHYGYSHEEFLGMTIKDIRPDEDVSKLVNHIENLGGRDQFSSEWLHRKKDGTLIHVEITSHRILWLERKARLVLALDITERKRAEESLKQRDKELELRNTELLRLYRASEALLTGALDELPELAQTIVQTILQEFEQSNCSLLLLNQETGDLERVAVAGPYARAVSNASLNLNKPGLVAKALRTLQIINAPNVLMEEEYAPNWEFARSELVIPLKVGNNVIGALDVQSPEPDAFHEDDERLMSIFANRAALALERTRLHEQTLKQLERLGALRAIDLAISNSLDMRISMNVVLEEATRQLGVDAACILLLKPENGRLEYAMGRGFRTRKIESTSLRLGEGMAGRVALERVVLSLEDIRSGNTQFTRNKLLEEEHFVSYYGVPLTARGEVKGVLEIFHRAPLEPDMEWLDFLDGLGWQTSIAIDNALLVQGMQRSNTNLILAYEATIEGWSHALDLRDKETEGHTQRVTDLTLKLARVLNIDEAQIPHIRRGALLHDIGKMGVPDHILLKEGPLTDAEWDIMRQHPQFAYDLLSPISYLREALDIPFCHHEKWNGTGYPRKLSGAQIPFAARIFAVVDVWDAITSDRPYRKKWSRQKAIKYIREQSGEHFDPAIVEVFLDEIIKQDKEIIKPGKNMK